MRLSISQRLNLTLASCKFSRTGDPLTGSYCFPVQVYHHRHSNSHLILTCPDRSRCQWESLHIWRWAQCPDSGDLLKTYTIGIVLQLAVIPFMKLMNWHAYICHIEHYKLMASCAKLICETLTPQLTTPTQAPASGVGSFFFHSLCYS